MKTFGCIMASLTLASFSFTEKNDPLKLKKAGA